MPAATIDHSEVGHFPRLAVLSLHDDRICGVVEFSGQARQGGLTLWRNSLEQGFKIIVVVDFDDLDGERDSDLLQEVGKVCGLSMRGNPAAD